MLSHSPLPVRREKSIATSTGTPPIGVEVRTGRRRPGGVGELGPVVGGDDATLWFVRWLPCQRARPAGAQG
jgi:hypothetical protein